MTSDQWQMLLGGTAAGSSPALTAGVWSHVVVTYDGTTVRYYVNGVATTTSAKAGAITTSTSAAAIGRRPDAFGYFKGAMDEVAVYSVALSAARIAARIAAHYAASW